MENTDLERSLGPQMFRLTAQVSVSPAPGRWWGGENSVSAPLPGLAAAEPHLFSRIPLTQAAQPKGLEAARQALLTSIGSGQAGPHLSASLLFPWGVWKGGEDVIGHP